MTTNNTTLACHPTRTSVVDLLGNQCVCWAGFYGDRCELRYSWWAPVMIPFHVIETLGLVLLLIATLIRMVSGCCTKGHTKGLFVRLVLAFVFIGTVCQVAFDLMPSASLFDQPQSVSTTGIKAVLTYMAQIFWITATMLITGFWHDALRMKAKKMTLSKKLILSLSISQAILVIVCAFVLFSLASDLSGVPLDVAVLLCIALVIYHIHQLRTVILPEVGGNEQRRRYVVTWLLTLLIGGWVVLEASYGFGVLLAFNGLSQYLAITKAMANLARVIVATGLVALLDYRGLALRQAAMRCLCCFKHNSKVHEWLQETASTQSSPPSKNSEDSTISVSLPPSKVDVV